MTRNRATPTLPVCDFEITESDIYTYQAAADFLNSSHVDLV